MSSTAMDPWAPLRVKLGELKKTWPAPQWKWDGRLVAVESVFQTTAFDAAHASAKSLFPAQWSSATLSQAPDAMRTLAQRTGGLREGQLLFVGDAIETVVPYGLWWPWGSGTAITLRIGFADVSPSVEPYLLLRELFGVTA